MPTVQQRIWKTGVQGWWVSKIAEYEVPADQEHTTFVLDHPEIFHVENDPWGLKFKTLWSRVRYAPPDWVQMDLPQATSSWLNRMQEFFMKHNLQPREVSLHTPSGGVRVLREDFLMAKSIGELRRSEKRNPVASRRERVSTLVTNLQLHRIPSRGNGFPEETRSMTTPRIAWGGQGYWLGRDGQLLRVENASQHVFYLEKHPDHFGFTAQDVRNDHALEQVYDQVVATWCKVRMLNGRVDFQLPAWDRVWLKRVQEAVVTLSPPPNRVLIFDAHDPHAEIDTDRATLLESKSFPQLQKAPRAASSNQKTLV